MKRPPLSWNRYPRVWPAEVRSVDNRHANLAGQASSLLAYGNGRSYGDVCLNEDGALLLTRKLDRFIEFDPASGRLRCEAGVTLEEVLNLVVPRGWFLPSTPGTRFATVGGCLANDTHGKNHHVMGTFGHHVTCLELLRSDGSRFFCSPQENADYFRATIGGLGLTGLVTWVELQLMAVQNPFMWVTSRRFGSLDEFWGLNDEAESSWPYTVAWIDCLATGRHRGRGIYLTARHSATLMEMPAYREKQRHFPIDPPFSLVNRLSLRAFNALYYRQPVKPAGYLSHYHPYFYPLDKIGDWNRIYGRKGFLQYQCVLPPGAASGAVAEMLDLIAASGQGSFLAVLKTFGDHRPAGMLSFARAGTTLALDFPRRGDRTFRLFDRLDEIVYNCGGALYPAKDARMSPAMFRNGFPAWREFSRYMDPRFSSSFWRRVTE